METPQSHSEEGVNKKRNERIEIDSDAGGEVSTSDLQSSRNKGHTTNIY